MRIASRTSSAVWRPRTPGNVPYEYFSLRWKDAHAASFYPDMGQLYPFRCGFPEGRLRGESAATAYEWTVGRALKAAPDRLEEPAAQIVPLPMRLL